MNESPIRELARLHGVMTSYCDVEGAEIEATEESLVFALRALGVPIETGEDPAAALKSRRRAIESCALPAVSVVWERDRVLIKLGPGGGDIDGGTLSGEGGEWSLTREDGPYLALEERLPRGYYELVAGTETSRVIVAPRRAYSPPEEERTWSLFLPLYALRTEKDWGAGDFTGLGELAAWAKERGADGVATLPLCAAFLDDPYEPSPYSPASRLFLNELYVDPTNLPELQSSKAAREILESPDFLAEREALRSPGVVDARRLMALKRRVLEPLARAKRTSARKKAYREFVAGQPDLAEYAAFRADLEGGGAVAGEYHRYVQWVAEEQLAAAAARGGLHLDLPLGVHGDGFDVARRPELFARGAAGGAPPDPLCRTGQNWGFPPPHPEANRRDGYRYLRACLSQLMRHATSLRIDHVMGLHRLFWVPDGRPASEGVYVAYPQEELYAVLLLESHRHRCRLVGENLGTVPPAVNTALVERNLRRMYVLPFELRAGRPKPVPRDVQASVGTHDMPTFAGWWKSLPAALKARLLESLDAGERPYEACLTRLSESAAREVVVGLEDLWGEEQPQNVPGTPGAENFRRKAALALESFQSDPEVQRLLREVNRGRREPRAALLSRPDVENRTLLTDDDLYLFGEGTHAKLYEKMGAHPEGDGTHFAVWAPNAERVSVIGTFNDWDAESHVLFPQGSSGIWAGFLPGVKHGDIYKYQVNSRHRGYRVQKADPFAAHAETPPRTASVVWDLDYEWRDGDWMANRAERNALDAPISIYEVHLGSWMRVPEEGSRSLTYRELAARFPAHVKDLGFTHVEFLPVMEHPFGGSWGYQVTGYFAPTSRFGTPQDFMFLVESLHRAGIGVILDWVPSHFPRDEHGPGYFDGTHLFEHEDPRRGLHPDWDSLIFNYGRNEVRSFLTSAALTWLDTYHIDGLRTDAVASMLYLDYSRREGEWIPNEQGGRDNTDAIRFLKRMNEAVYSAFPDVQTIAEESTSWPMVSKPTFEGGLGFGMKWDMGWMHDTLTYLAKEPIHRKHHQNDLTFRQIYAYSENFVLSLSHDEVVHGKANLIGKMPGDDWQKFANLRLLLAYMYAQNGKKLVFMGIEIAQWNEWDHDGSLDWHLLDYEPHRGVRDLTRELNTLLAAQPALHEKDCDHTGFEWVECTDADSSVLTFLRKSHREDETILAVCHFTPVVREDYRIGVPGPGPWSVLLNSDEERFGGSGKGPHGEVTAEEEPWNGRPFSIRLDLPPLAAVYLSPPSEPHDPVRSADSGG